MVLVAACFPPVAEAIQSRQQFRAQLATLRGPCATLAVPAVHDFCAAFDYGGGAGGLHNAGSVSSVKPRRVRLFPVIASSERCVELQTPAHSGSERSKRPAWPIRKRIPPGARVWHPCIFDPNVCRNLSESERPKTTVTVGFYTQGIVFVDWGILLVPGKTSADKLRSMCSASSGSVRRSLVVA